MPVGPPAVRDGPPAATDGTPAVRDETPAVPDGTPAALDGTPAATAGVPSLLAAIPWMPRSTMKSSLWASCSLAPRRDGALSPAYALQPHRGGAPLHRRGA